MKTKWAIADLNQTIIKPWTTTTWKVVYIKGKQPNSGDFLKLLIPNQDEFFRGGWTNYSRMVISLMMALHLHRLMCTKSDIGVFNPNAVELQARKMDNRGSKSNIIMFVKEQRVDGSYTNLKSSLVLRCTLRGFERITLAGFSPNKILNKGLYSTTVRNANLIQPILSNKYEDSFSLNPWFITGFTLFLHVKKAPPYFL